MSASRRGEQAEGSGGTTSAVKRREPRAATQWNTRGRFIDLDRPRVVGVVNVTPDSFSDGGDFFSPANAIEHASRLIEEGADVLEIGGESTRPQGATAISVSEELRRVIPVVSEIAGRFPSAVIAVDTVKAKVAEASLEAGAHIINDVSGLRLDQRMASVCAANDAGLVIMHSRGQVHDMATYEHAGYGDDPLGEAVSELLVGIERARRAGLAGENIVIDPGLGFSKRSAHSRQILRELSRFTDLGYPVLIGASRKRFIGELSGVQKPADRIFGSIAAAVVGLLNGAALFRVHDVLATRQALDVAWGLMAEEGD